jgi:hypothetical protein
MTRLQAIQEREQKATAGPWAYDDHIVHPGDTPGEQHVYEMLEDDPPLVSFSDKTVDDMRFIVSARADVPWLLARVEQMRALIAKAVMACPVCNGDGSYWLRGPGTVKCMRCLDARVALAALDEEVPETVQS